MPSSFSCSSLPLPHLFKGCLRNPRFRHSAARRLCSTSTCIYSPALSARQSSNPLSDTTHLAARRLQPQLKNLPARSFSDQTHIMPPAGQGDAPHKKHKVTIVGSGNWGSAIAKILAENTALNDSVFERDVQMYVYEEEYTLPKSSKHYDAGSELAIKPQKLTTLINRLHENVKYLPGIPLPENIVANPDIADAVKDSTILVFNLPHQFLKKTCEGMKGKVLPFARGISCIKGVDVSEQDIHLFSESICSTLGIYCGALSGANIANEVALEKFSETTIAYDPPPMDSRQGTPSGSRSGSPSRSQQQDSSSAAKDNLSPVKLQPMPMEYPPLTHALIRSLFHRPYFHVRLVHDVAGVSLGGALKNIVALAAGFVDGLGWGDNAKAAIMRVGILEQVKFGQMFFPNSFEPKTMTEESCGVADMITSCASGRNFRSARMAVQRGVSVDEIERTEMNGQKLQGASTAEEVSAFLKARGCQGDFPLFCAVYDILKGKVKPEQLPDLIEKKDS